MRRTVRMSNAALLVLLVFVALLAPCKGTLQLNRPRVKHDATRDATLHLALRRAQSRRQAMAQDPASSSSGTSNTSTSSSHIMSINDLNSGACMNSAWPFLQIQTYASPPFVFIHDDGSGNVVYTGLTMDLLSQLAVNVGFCYNLTYVPGVRATGSVQAAANTSTPINLAMGTITTSASRFAMDVHFTEPYYNTGLRLFTRADEVSGGWFGFVKPFSPTLWLVFLSMSIVFALSLLIFERRKNEEEFWYSGVWRNLALSIHYTTEYLFCQGQFRPVTGPARIMLVGFLLMVLAAIAGYTAQLASFLTNKGLVSSVLDVNGDGAINVVDIQAQAASICIVANSSVEAFFIREIGNVYIVSTTVPDCINAVANMSALGFLYDEALLQYYAATMKGFMVTGELLYKQGYGIPVSPLFPNLSAALSIEIMNLQQSGALEIYEKAWIPDVSSSASNEQAKSLTLMDYIGLFMVFLLFLLLAWPYHLIQEYRHGFPSYKGKREAVITEAERTQILRNIKSSGQMPPPRVFNRLTLQLLLEMSLSQQGTSQGEPTGIADTQEPMSDKLAKLPDPGRPSLPDTEESLLVSTPSA